MIFTAALREDERVSVAMSEAVATFTYGDTDRCTFKIPSEYDQGAVQFKFSNPTRSDLEMDRVDSTITPENGKYVTKFRYFRPAHQDTGR